MSRLIQEHMEYLPGPAEETSKRAPERRQGLA